MEPFHTKDGKQVETLSEMADALESMSDENYNHHISPQRNDVAIWVQDIHHNEELSKALGQAKDKETTVALLREINQAVFPSEEEYHPTQGVGKEDPELHDTYNKKEEWDAAKDAAHPEEEVENPATGEVSKGDTLSNIAEEYNSKEGPEESQNEAAVVPEEEIQSTPKSNIEKKPENLSSEPPKVVPEDLNPSPSTKNKDRIIFLLIGLIVGLIIGYGLSLVI